MLTDERIIEIRDKIQYGDGWDGDSWDNALARAIEAEVRKSMRPYNGRVMSAQDHEEQMAELMRLYESLLEERNRYRERIKLLQDDVTVRIQLAEQQAERIAELEKIEAAARNVFKVKGRHNTQIAMCRLGELLGERVTWPEKGERNAD